MNRHERIWWEELAEQYREWAENPPVYRGVGENYTCWELNSEGWGFADTPRHGDADCYLFGIWCWRYGEMDYPAGRRYDLERHERRFEFCHWMAEAIDDFLETGKGPWETE